MEPPDGGGRTRASRSRKTAVVPRDAPSPDRDLICKTCGAVFTRVDNRLRHENSGKCKSSPAVPVPSRSPAVPSRTCPDCAVMFSRPANMERHRRTGKCKGRRKDPRVAASSEAPTAFSQPVETLRPAPSASPNGLRSSSQPCLPLTRSPESSPVPFPPDADQAEPKPRSDDGGSGGEDPEEESELEDEGELSDLTELTGLSELSDLSELSPELSELSETDQTTEKGKFSVELASSPRSESPSQDPLPRDKDPVVEPDPGPVVGETERAYREPAIQSPSPHPEQPVAASGGPSADAVRRSQEPASPSTVPGPGSAGESQATASETFPEVERRSTEPASPSTLQGPEEPEASSGGPSAEVERRSEEPASPSTLSGAPAEGLNSPPAPLAEPGQQCVGQTGRHPWSPETSLAPALGTVEEERSGSVSEEDGAGLIGAGESTGPQHRIQRLLVDFGPI